MGILPAQPIGIEYATGKAESFKLMAEETDSSRVTMTGTRRSGEGAAFHSQIRMMNNYNEDVWSIEESQREYDSMAPLGNLAVQSFAKLQMVGKTIGVDEGFQLDAKETAALGPASRTAENIGMLQDGEGHSVKSAADKVSGLRVELLGAGTNMASVADKVVLRKLKEELETEKGNKEKIEKKIEKIAGVIGYLDKAGALVAGGAGLVAGPGAAATAAAELDEASAVAPEMKSLQEGGDKVEKAGGPLEGIAKVGLEMFYAKEMNAIQGKIATITAEIPGAEYRLERDAIKAAKDHFDGVARLYESAVENYKLAINNRRESMGAIGGRADNVVDKTGNDAMDSQAMVYTATAYETQSFLGTAMEAGARTQAKVDQASHDMRTRRNQHWGMLSDAMDVTNEPRTEGEDGPDIQGIKHMSRLMMWWMQGAGKVAGDVDRQVDKKASHVMGAVGYSGHY